MSARLRLFLIDGNSYIYRAYFAIRNLSTSKGLPTNAIYGFTTMLLKIIRDHRPDYLAVAFDAKGPTLRHAEYKDYKAQRPEMPDPLRQQIPYIHRLVEAFRMPVLLESEPWQRAVPGSSPAWVAGNADTCTTSPPSTSANSASVPSRSSMTTSGSRRS